MAIKDDISVAANGDVRYTGTAHEAAGAGYYTVIELHRLLGDLADDASSSGDDVLDITDDTPSDRSTDNIITMLAPYNIDQELAEHLFDGSIIQSGGDDIWDGVVNFGSEGIHIEVMQNGALIANAFWNSSPSGVSGKGLNRDNNAGISHRFLVKTRTSGSDIDGRRLLGLAREFGYNYSEFPINGTSRGNNVLALKHAGDLNNQTVEGTVSGWTDITNTTEGYAGIDVDNNSTDEFYYSEWNMAARSPNDLYERMKWLTRRGSASTLYGLDGDVFRGITHEIGYSSPSGTMDEGNPVTFANGATAQVLADNGSNKMWVQLLTGVAPTSGSISQTVPDAASATFASITPRTISTPFSGASTGSAIIGSYGYGVEAGDLSATDKVFDLTNTQVTPPNNVMFVVGGLVSGEDRVLVGPESGGEIQTDQLSSSGSITNGQATIDCVEDIPLDTPSTGTIRIWNGDTYSRVTYTGWSGKNFTGCSGAPVASDGADIWISYIDKTATGTTASFTGVYVSDRALFIRVRDGGGTPIKTFETTGTLGSSGGSSTAIRTSDS